MHKEVAKRVVPNLLYREAEKEKLRRLKWRTMIVVELCFFGTPDNKQSSIFEFNDAFSIPDIDWPFFWLLSMRMAQAGSMQPPLTSAA